MSVYGFFKTATETSTSEAQLGFNPVRPPVERLQINGMTDISMKTFKRELKFWFEHYNE
ncbi:hypothetical protein GCM10007875_21120 [Limnobacter litoralis]|uniref:Uncharacterized protein n=1 Tax=Limnobacter litoralis TaxID=481366 RepID=A0ABQ5YU89_9BURK|nr:hypothetical protein GCM10007875_21120 [Limnobacter litoralis]